MMLKWLTVVCTGITMQSAPLMAEPDFAKQRLAMVETIRKTASDYKMAIGPEGISPRVLEVMSKVERHLFIPEGHTALAYDDQPVPIGDGQTISQPFIVALMSHLAEPKPNHTVLEVGTGSGYQAAVLAELVRKVCTIEIFASHGERAARILRDLGYANISTKIGDGYWGWQSCGPFDAVIVTAALDHVPEPLIDQLKIGGRLVMPVGPATSVQKLTVVEKQGPSSTKTKIISMVSFVPFLRNEK